MPISLLELTRYLDNEPVYINPDYITSFIASGGDGGTLLLTVDGRDEWHIKETPREIIELLRRCNAA